MVAVAPAGGYATESWTATATVEKFLAEFAGWDDRLTGLAANPTQALRRYEAERIDRASRVQQGSHARVDFNHLPDGPEQQARDEALRAADPLAANAWLYAHDPLSPNRPAHSAGARFST
jgi:2-polyprenyl-6-methoxyphenol hydroxylase-like FAD-dependent oxidoreductase